MFKQNFHNTFTYNKTAKGKFADNRFFHKILIDFALIDHVFFFEELPVCNYLSVIKYYGID